MLQRCVVLKIVVANRLAFLRKTKKKKQPAMRDMLHHFHHRPYIALDQSAPEDSLSYCKISVFVFIIKQKKQG